MNPVEWLIYGAAETLQRRADDEWWALPKDVRDAAWLVSVRCHRLLTPYPDLPPLINALVKPSANPR